MDLFWKFIALYCAMAFVKFVLALPHVGTVVALQARVAGKPRGCVPLDNLIITLIALPITVLYAWPAALRDEGWRFFIVDRKFTVMRSCLRAHKELAEQ